MIPEIEQRADFLKAVAQRADLLKAIAELSQRCPDTPVGQLVENLAHETGQEIGEVKDEQLLAAVQSHSRPPLFPEALDNFIMEQVVRDICGLYHLLTKSSSIVGEFSYRTVFALPYWDFMESPGSTPQERAFLREGCLVMILSMAWDKIDGAGNYINPRITACRSAVSRLECEDDETQRLIRTVLLALDLAERHVHESVELGEESIWVHKRYVRGYFRRVAQDFDSNPYFKN